MVVGVNPNGIVSFSPGLSASADYPGTSVPDDFQPQRGCSFRSQAGLKMKRIFSNRDEAWLSASIPTGLDPSAQGCPRRRTTLGPTSPMIFNPNGVVALCRSAQMQPRQGCLGFDRQPKVARAAQPWAEGWNPVGIRKQVVGSRVWRLSAASRMSLECADMSAPWNGATCRVGGKRRHVAAVQIKAGYLVPPRRRCWC